MSHVTLRVKGRGEGVGLMVWWELLKWRKDSRVKAVLLLLYILEIIIEIICGCVRWQNEAVVIVLKFWYS